LARELRKSKKVRSKKSQRDMRRSSPRKTKAKQVPPKVNNQLEKLNPPRLLQLRNRKRKKPLLSHWKSAR